MKTQTTAQPETIFDRELRPLVEREVMSNPAQATSAAVRDVLAERQRQIEVEGWTANHDDAEHDGGDLASAGAAYAINAADHLNPFSQGDGNNNVPECWPWFSTAEELGDDGVVIVDITPSGWKPKNPRRDLVRAAALIIAEIERMDRVKS